MPLLRTRRLNPADGRGLRRVQGKGEERRIKKSLNVPSRVWLGWQNAADGIDMPVSELVEKCGVIATRIGFQRKARKRFEDEAMMATSIKVTETLWLEMRRVARERKLKLWQLLDQSIRSFGPETKSARIK